MNEAQCSHSKVVLKHIDHADGTRSDYWECDDCVGGTRFVPEPYVDFKLDQLNGLRAVCEAAHRRGLNMTDDYSIKHLVELPMTEKEYYIFMQAIKENKTDVVSCFAPVPAPGWQWDPVGAEKKTL